MTKIGAVFWLGVVLASGFTTFQVKHAVQEIDDELTRVRKHAIAEQQEIRVLAAEWTYLNQPERLAELNRAFLQLAPIAPKQLQQRIEDIPLRPPPAPPDVLLAANPPVAEAPAGAPPTPAAAIAVAAATGGSAPVPAPAPVRAVGAAPVRFAKAMPGSLDALIAQIAEGR